MYLVEALAGNASDAVRNMAERDRQAQAEIAIEVDKMTTGSIKSPDQFDAPWVL